MLSLAKLSIAPGMHPLSGMVSSDARAKISDNAWPVFASLSWAFVMYLFRWYPETVVSSLRHSMKYMYVVWLFCAVLVGDLLTLLEQLRRLESLGLVPQFFDF